MGGSPRLKFLLDSHIWLWLVAEPAKLKPRTLREIRNVESELWLSPISTWELLTLDFKRRVRLHPTPEEWLKRAIVGTHEAPLTHEIALAARQLSMHQDPADRILAATAKVLDLTLVTADSRLLGLPAVRCLANR